jgi:hypothetical protein
MVTKFRSDESGRYLEGYILKPMFRAGVREYPKSLKCAHKQNGAEETDPREYRIFVA